MLDGHLTACWCWEQTDPDNIRFHMLAHKVHEATESFNLMVIAWEVAQWEPTNPRKEIA